MRYYVYFYSHRAEERARYVAITEEEYKYLMQYEYDLEGGSSASSPCASLVNEIGYREETDEDDLGDRFWTIQITCC